MASLRGMAGRQGKIVAVDPKVGNMPLYRGVTIITPNHLEALAAARVSPDQRESVYLAGRQLLKDLGSRYVLVTQGEQGMTLFSGEGEVHIPTAAKRVFDVTGAGDTVISTLTLALATGLKPQEAAYLANLAAGVVVGEVGTSAVTGGRLLKVLEEQACPGGGPDRDSLSPWAGEGGLPPARTRTRAPAGRPGRNGNQFAGGTPRFGAARRTVAVNRWPSIS